MAHPKRKISKTRRDKRRTHYKVADSQISTCKTTGEAHLYHRGIKGEHIIKLQILKFQLAKLQERLTYITGLTGMKENYIIEVRF